MPHLTCHFYLCATWYATLCVALVIYVLIYITAQYKLPPQVVVPQVDLHQDGIYCGLVMENQDFTTKIRKSIGFQILLRSKYVPSLVKIHWRMLILVFTRMLRSKKLTRWHCEHSRINILQWILTKLGTYLVLTRVWNPIDCQGHSKIFTA
jgi:hypothetical protein